MKKPLVAIVGRPNVGKSTFFNKIAGRRISIVEDTPGVTRDRIYADAEWCGHMFTIVDTGGLDFESTDEMNKNIQNQAQLAVDLADVIVFFADGKEGVTSSDLEIADYLRKSKKPVVLAVNKVDDIKEEAAAYEFYRLNLGEPHAISSSQGLGIGDILDEIVKNFPRRHCEPNPNGGQTKQSKNMQEHRIASPTPPFLGGGLSGANVGADVHIGPQAGGQAEQADENAPIKIAIVGKPNAGKSSLTNKLLGEERVVVSAVAGTTRDAIDTPFKYEGKEYILIDTAGMRKKSAIDPNSIERYSIIRALDAVGRADVVLIVIDASVGITEQDVKIAAFAHENFKPSVIVINKWDIIEKDDKTINLYNKQLEEDLKFMSYFVTVYVSALTGMRLNKIMPIVLEVLENSRRRITTGALNDIIQDAITVKEPPLVSGRRLKILFATQAGISPPTFVLFVNDSKNMHFSYQRYLENCIRRSIDLKGTPIKLVVKSRGEKE